MLPINRISIVMTVCCMARMVLSSPVFNLHSSPISTSLGTMGRNIRHLPCVSLRTGTQGVCMFAIDCLKANGTHLGTCIDRFYFGSCCHMPENSDTTSLESTSGLLDNTIEEIDNDVKIKPSINVNKPLVSLRPPNTPLTTLTTTRNTTPKPPSTTISTRRSTTTSRPTTTPTPTSRTTKRPITTTTQNKTVSNNRIHSSTTPRPITSTSNRQPVTTTQRPITSTPYRRKPTESSTTSRTTTEKFVTVQTVQTTTPRRPSASPVRLTTPKPISTTAKSNNRTTARPASRPTTPKPTPTTRKPSPPTTQSANRTKPTNSVKQNVTTTTTNPFKISTFQSVVSDTFNLTKSTTTTRRPILKPQTPHSNSSTSTIRPKPSQNSTSAKPTSKPKPTQKPLRPSEVTKKPIRLPSTTVATVANKTSKPTTAKPSVVTTTKKPTPPTTTVKPSSSVATKKPSEKPIISSTTLTTTTTTARPQAVSVNTTTSKPGSQQENVSTNEVLPLDEESSPLPGLVTWTSLLEPTTTPVPITNNTSSIAGEPEDWTPITPPDGWILLPSVSPNDQQVENSTTLKPSTLTPNTTKIPTESTMPNRPTVPVMFPTIATHKPPMVFPGLNTSGVPENVTTPTEANLTNATTESTSKRPETFDNDLDSMASVNMSDYRNVCGRRMYPQARIVGGEKSAYGRWPWQISLRQWRTSTYLHKCGAALLNENWAITAAHCVANEPPSDLLLRLGEHDLSSESEPHGFQERRVQIVASHPQFDPRTFEYDLALLRFYEPVTFQPNIIPVCVPSSDESFVGKTAFVTGWGRLYEDGPLPSILQEVSVPIINNTVCEQMYRNAGYIEHIPNIFICAGWRRGGFDSCEGDSGGPLVIQRPEDKRFMLAGVISWGIGCAEPNQPGVYTRISEFRHWINQILQF